MKNPCLVSKVAYVAALSLLVALTGCAGDKGQRERASPRQVRAATAGEYVAKDTCYVKFNGYRIEGEAQVRLVKTGQKVIATVTGYSIKGADHGRKKANVDSDMRVWNDAAGSGAGHYFGMTRSADAMLQDGQWHDMNQSMGADVGFDVKRTHVGVQFTFDMAGGDMKCWADHFDVTF